MTTKTNPITYRIAMEVASHEAIVRQAYRNPGDVWTWSVGLTSATGHIVERYIGKPQSLDHCLRVYVWALDNYADVVRKVFAGLKAPLTEAQFAAALSYHWNTGAIETAPWVKLFLSGRWEEAEASFRKSRITKGGKPNAALKDRRADEADLLFHGKWSNSGTMTEYTRLNPNGSIVWSSRITINVEKQLRAALQGDIPASDKVIVEAPQCPAPSYHGLTVGAGGSGMGALVAAEPLAKGLEVLTTQQGEITSGDYVRVGVAVLIVVGAIWVAWRMRPR